MALNLQTAQTVALGAFNPHIVTPDWLVKMGIWADEEFKIRLHPLRQGLAFTSKEVDWRIDFRSLVVTSRNENCGILVSKVIKELPHTPVRGVVNNFNYACSKGDWTQSPSIDVTASDPPGLSDLGNLEETRWSWTIRTGNARVDLTLVKEDAGMAVLFSFYRETNNATDKASAAAERFADDQQTSQDWIRQLFKQEVVA